MHNESLHSLLESVSPNIAVRVTNNKISMEVECLGRMKMWTEVGSGNLKG